MYASTSWPDMANIFFCRLSTLGASLDASSACSASSSSSLANLIFLERDSLSSSADSSIYSFRRGGGPAGTPGQDFGLKESSTEDFFRMPTLGAKTGGKGMSPADLPSPSGNEGNGISSKSTD